MGENLIEYDYIYTGRNIDILEFDIKMNMGMVYLQGMTIANPYKQPGQQVAIAGTHPAGIDILTRQNGQNIPVFFGTNIKTASIKDTQDTKQTSQFSYSMTKHASLESIEAAVKITGNPHLLGSINATTDPKNMAQRVNIPSADDNFAKFSDWSLAPCFAKINIKMPRNNDDQSLFTGSQTSEDETSKSNDYAVDFWFSGYYFIYGIQHVFDNGEFYQNLQALGIPEKNSFTQEKNTSAERDVKLGKLVQECYDNVIGCGGSSNKSPTTTSSAVLPEKPPPDIIDHPRIKQEVSEDVPRDRNLSNIKGYDGAPEEVKQAIHNAAVNNGVDEFTLAQFAAVESKFGANMGKPSHNAQGLFQFTTRTKTKHGWVQGGTWAAYGRGASVLDMNANADAAARYMKHNTKVIQKALPGHVVTASDLYLAHNQGEGGGPAILKQIAAGNGNHHANVTDDALTGQGLPTDSTALEVQIWAKNIMGGRLKNGAPYDNYDKLQVTNTDNVSETASKQQPKAKDMLSAYTSCSDEEKKQEDPAKSSTCPKVPDSKADNATVSSSNKIDNGQATPNKNSSTVVTGPSTTVA